MLYDHAGNIHLPPANTKHLPMSDFPQDFNISTGATAGAAGAAVAIAQATRASGVIVRVEPASFRLILERQEAPLVVHATGGFFTTSHQFLTSYKGLAFFTKTNMPLDLPADTEVVEAQKIWIPG